MEITRRCLFFFSALLVSQVSTYALIAAETRPNIICVFIDDMGWNDFSCFGNPDAETPNIDRLAKEGVRFTQFYVNSPICSPSRCALTTGQYPQRWKITSFLNNRNDNQRRGMAQWLSLEAPTLAKILQQNRYATGHFGKWHLGGQRDVNEAPSILKYGFDESLTNFEGMGPKLLPLTMRPGAEKPGRIWDKAEILGGPVVWMQRSEITSGFVDSAMAFMRRAQLDEKPFFVNIWPDDVHGPFWPPVDQWGDGGKRTLYLAVLEEMDRQLARILDHVRNTPALRENTLILVCSDNGPELGAGKATPYRGYKTQLYEGGIRSPLVVWGPGLIPQEHAGQTNETSVFAAFDLAPSLLKIVGIETPAEIEFDGEALPDVVLGKSNASRQQPLFFRRPPDRDSFYGEADLPDLAVRDGDWKLLCEYDGSGQQLYDLSKDPSETTNLAKEFPEVVKKLGDAVLAWHQSMPADNGPQLIGAKGQNRGKRTPKKK